MKYLNSFKQINEVHYTDKYGEEFVKFRKEWSSAKTSRYEYYVQFTNTKNDLMDKSAHIDNDHHDPVGNYAYPLKYVIDYPMDIWYGQNANYLRVLESKSKNTLYLSDIKTESDCDRVLNNIFGNTILLSSLYKEVKKTHSNKIEGSKKWAKMCFQCIQVDYSNDKPIVRTGLEQTKLLLKGGYDAVEDEARTIKTAVVNDREPNQIIFLRPTSFKVAQIYNLRNNNTNITTPDHKSVLSRKWVSILLNYMNDKIKESDGIKNGIEYFYTVKGRQIEIDFRHSDNTHKKDISIGQKAHKVFKLYDNYKARINLSTEYGNILLSLPEDEKFITIVNKLKDTWKTMSKGKIVSGWSPITKQSVKEKEDAERREYRNKEEEKKNNEYMSKYSEWKERIDYWANKYNIEFIHSDIDTMIKYMDMDETLFNQINHTISSERCDEIIDDYINLMDDSEKFPDDPRLFLELNFGKNDDQTLKNVINYYEIFRNLFHDSKKHSHNLYAYYTKME